MSELLRPPSGKFWSASVTGIDCEKGNGIFSKKKYHFKWLTGVKFCETHTEFYKKDSHGEDQIFALVRNGFGDVIIDVFDPEKHKEKRENKDDNDE